MSTVAEDADASAAGPRVLVAGIGNIFLGDDGFGVEVVDRLNGTPSTPGVTVVDFGIRGVHLAYEMLAGQYDVTILVDAVPWGQAPGSVYLIEAESVVPAGQSVDAHGMDPVAVLALVRRLGGEPGRVLVVGCEPLRTDEGIGLSPPVAAAVDQAVRLARRVTEDLVAGRAIDGLRVRAPADVTPQADAQASSAPDGFA